MMYAVVDCDNCFVSCERVFQPELLGKPVVVLSNNDGCVVARSNEAKALGIKMGVPIYQIKDLCRTNDVQIRSSNYILYADMSNRVMSILREEVGPGKMEQYSIDEAFLTIDVKFDYKQNFFCYDYEAFGFSSACTGGEGNELVVFKFFILDFCVVDGVGYFYGFSINYFVLFFCIAVEDVYVWMRF